VLFFFVSKRRCSLWFYGKYKLRLRLKTGKEESERVFYFNAREDKIREYNIFDVPIQL
jgi:hypothetical protein